MEQDILGTKLPYQIKNINSVENFCIKIGWFQKNSKKKNLRGHFWELSDKLLYKI